MKQYPITKPYFDKKEIKALEGPVKAGWLVQGERVKEFESLVAGYTKAKFASACTSCTTALHMALIACGVKEQDEVIIPSLTFVATANVVEYMNAKPVFVDIDIDTFNIDPEKLEKKITKKTKAIMPVHLFGLCADMAPVMKIAKKHNLKVIEDAACAVGSTYRGKHAGTIGDAGAFSFHPRKLITCGEGGMLITDNKDINKLVRTLREHGAHMDDLVRHKKNIAILPDYKVLGYNYRLTDLQASVAVEQMKKLDMILKERIRKANYYDKLLKNTEFIKIPEVPKGYKHSYQSYVCIVDNTNLKSLKEKHLYRNRLMSYLKDKGISTRIGTHCVPALHYYKNKYKIKKSDFENALTAEYLSMTLPLYHILSRKNQEYIAKQIKDFIG
ncbi:MAG: DegT/DnrJ/EryC1/StrS family aminotransferase [Armatimonadota bacterium]